MLEELQTMQSIEMEVVLREREWIEGGLAALAEDIGAHPVETQEGRFRRAATFPGQRKYGAGALRKSGTDRRELLRSTAQLLWKARKA